MFFWDNIAQDEVVAFLREVMHHLRGHVIALLDNSNTHKGAPLRDLCKRFPRLHLEHFPPYAPDLKNCILWCATELNSRAQIEQLVEVLARVPSLVGEGI